MRYWKDTENKDPKIVRTKNNRLITQSKYSFFGLKKTTFIKEQGLLSKVYWVI